MRHVRTLVIGAGPTGLGAAWRLHERGDTQWLVVEQSEVAGGAAASVVDDDGFTWDLGGHVIHSHYRYFDEALAACGIDWVYPERSGFVALAGAFVPVPLQHNLGSLSPKVLARVEAELSGGAPVEAANLEQWFRATFGETLSASFFEPFNSKMWAHPPAMLAHDWTSLRSGSAAVNVPGPVLRPGVSQDRSRFPYPRFGSGALWAAVAAQLPVDKLRFGVEVTQVFPHSKIVQLSSGERLSYTHLVSSMPLTHLLNQVHSSQERVGLLHSSVEVLGLGFVGTPPAALRAASWIYQPDPAVPFHRATMLSNYSSAMAGPGRWSILLECATSAHRPLDAENLVQDCLAALRTWGVGDPVSVWRRRLPFGYPVPTVGRDELLHPLLDELEAFGIRSRGRFGGWRYESCNQDYAFMQGVQAVDATDHGAPEDIFWPGRPSSSSTAA